MSSFSGDVRMKCNACRERFHKPYAFVKENPELACPHCGARQKIDLVALSDRDGEGSFQAWCEGRRHDPIISSPMREGVITRQRRR